MDHSATTPLRSEVLEEMTPFWQEHYGNPSSVHSSGRRANVALSKARKAIAQQLGAKPSEIIFTSGGTESDNAALRGIALARRAHCGANRLLVSAIEHHAVLHTAQDLATNYGFDLTILSVDESGLIRMSELTEALGSATGSHKADNGETGNGETGNGETDVALISVMMANNEIGTVQPVEQIGALCQELKVPFHTDAVQAAGKLALNVNRLGVDALSISAHKIYGPKGVGFLYLRNGTPFQPTNTGGTHEQGRRAGTENVPLIVGMAKAVELAQAERETEADRLIQLRDHLIGGILEAVPGSRLTGSWQNRLPHLASFVIEGIEAEGLLIGLDLAGIAASSGSACTSGAQRPSHVLEAIGVSATDAVGGLRLSLGKSTTADDVNYVLTKLPDIVARLRSFTPAIL